MFIRFTPDGISSDLSSSRYYDETIQLLPLSEKFQNEVKELRVLLGVKKTDLLEEGEIVPEEKLKEWDEYKFHKVQEWSKDGNRKTHKNMKNYDLERLVMLGYGEDDLYGLPIYQLWEAESERLVRLFNLPEFFVEAIGSYIKWGTFSNFAKVPMYLNWKQSSSVGGASSMIVKVYGLPSKTDWIKVWKKMNEEKDKFSNNTEKRYKEYGNIDYGIALFKARKEMTVNGKPPKWIDVIGRVSPIIGDDPPLTADDKEEVNKAKKAYARVVEELKRRFKS